ncbi:hypothetical protein NB705_003799 [Xanthomonas sacchari]|nr:hypothetical protein [Xanthomonas sacchari]
MDVAAALFADAGLAGHRAAACAIVVAHEHARRLRQRVQPLDRTVQRGRVAAGEIAARGAAVGHEQRIAREQRIADQVGDAVAGVAWHGDHLRLHITDREALAIGEQVIEAAARLRVRVQAELRRETGAHLADAVADRQRRLWPSLLEPLRGGDMIGVGVGLEDPAQVQSARVQARGQRLRRCVVQCAGLRVVAHHRVDHRGVVAILDHVAPGAGTGMVEGVDVRMLAHRSLRVAAGGAALQ